MNGVRISFCIHLAEIMNEQRFFGFVYQSVFLSFFRIFIDIWKRKNCSHFHGINGLMNENYSLKMILGNLFTFTGQLHSLVARRERFNLIYLNFSLVVVVGSTVLTFKYLVFSLFSP